LLAAVSTAGGTQCCVALMPSRDAAAITKQLPQFFDEIFVLLWRILVASINSL